jgi:hypothetical protein
MTQIYLAEITAYDPGLPGVVTLRYASGLGYNHPSAPGYYAPRLRQPGQIERSMFGSRTTLGAVETGIGEMSLVNHDGALDAIEDYALDGRALRLLIGDDAAVYSSFTTVFTGTMLAARSTEGEIQILVRDRLLELDKPLLTATYAGSNALPSGVEGVDDIKGRVKPRTYGVVKEIAPPLVNTARLIYQVSDGAIASLDAVYDNAIALTAGSTYSSQADMEANAPAAGSYRAWLAGGMFRLGSTPVGQITADVTQGATVGARTAAQVLQAIALAAGVPSGDILGSDVTALDTANAAPVGIWISEPRTAREVAQDIAVSVGAWFGFDRLGRFRMGRLDAPTGSPVVTLKRLAPQVVAEADTVDILTFALVTGNDADRGVPAYRVIVEYGRCYTPQPGALDGAITPERRAFLSLEYRSAKAEDLAVRTAHLLAVEITLRTLLAVVADADAEAARQLGMRKIKRQRLTISARLDAALAALLDLGVVVRVVVPRWGLAGGKLFRVIGMTNRLGAGVLDLELWG